MLYHIVFPTKYRRNVLDETIDKKIKEVCLEIGNKYEIHFVEIGTDKDHVHFLIQSIPTYNITKIVTIIKSITAKKVFEAYPEIKEKMWGANLWTSGY